MVDLRAGNPSSTAGPTVKLRPQLRTELVPSTCTGATLEETSLKVISLGQAREHMATVKALTGVGSVQASWGRHC